MRKFDALFAAPQEFYDGELVVSRRAFPTAEDARQEFNRWGLAHAAYACWPVIENTERIRASTVRFMPWPETGELRWQLDEDGPGAQPVWVYDPERSS